MAKTCRTKNLRNQTSTAIIFLPHMFLPFENFGCGRRPSKALHFGLWLGCAGRLVLVSLWLKRSAARAPSDPHSEDPSQTNCFQRRSSKKTFKTAFPRFAFSV